MKNAFQIPHGYILVSAFLDEDPILAWSYDGKVDSSSLETNVKSINKTNGIKPKIVWYGTSDIFLSYDLNSNNKLLASADGNEIEGDFSSLSVPKPQQNENNRKQWGLIKNVELMSPGQTDPYDGVTTIDPETWETNYSSVEKKYIHTANQKQWYYTTIGGIRQATGCSPTAASNIIEYWARNGYSKLNPHGSQTNIVMDLRTHMKTYQSPNGDGTTAPSNIASGLHSYALEKLGQANGSFARNVNLASYDSYKRELDAGRPALQSYWHQTYFGDHTVTVVGYKTFVKIGLDSDYLVIKNNFVNETHGNMYIKWGSWSTNVMTAFNPKGGL